ncbi:hypothetical protein HYPSUDRAFT_206481 [Hypholoma sublateritium FD-334 SS-4]|uniref:Uncharacterized protein n=1 Tax=Hypholoma sublateritium (strain FD-334 SS-4) TaxID=945553 RepID=A0A0D2M1W0_HYPSF|nr:hypothetical protein HYPSUDRAFT_206481 [Hypholoma sublateritium FD-334 SS-4]
MSARGQEHSSRAQVDSAAARTPSLRSDRASIHRRACKGPPGLNDLRVDHYSTLLRTKSIRRLGAAPSPAPQPPCSPPSALIPRLFQWATSVDRAATAEGTGVARPQSTQRAARAAVIRLRPRRRRRIYARRTSFPDQVSASLVFKQRRAPSCTGVSHGEVGCRGPASPSAEMG